MRKLQGPDQTKDICISVKQILYDMSYDTVLKLALLTWHFNASSSTASQELQKFLSYQSDNAVIVIIQDRYRGIMGRTGPLDDTFDFLLVMD